MKGNSICIDLISFYKAPMMAKCVHNETISAWLKELTPKKFDYYQHIFWSAPNWHLQIIDSNPKVKYDQLKKERKQSIGN